MGIDAKKHLGFKPGYPRLTGNQIRETKEYRRWKGKEAF
jgi:hypothetical protein